MGEKLLPDAAVEATYARIAKHHDAWASRAEGRAKARALELAEIRPGERVLEVGVGTGLLFVEAVKALGGQGFALGVDRTEEMLARARARLGGESGPSFRLERGDARALAVADKSFDVAFSCYLLDLLDPEGIRAVLREIRRALKPGGRAALASMTHAESFWHASYGALSRIDPRLFGGCRPISLPPYVEEAGLRIVTREYVSEMLFPSEVVLAIAP
jgi:ubiquinone/menaquinone biosynthesis C-methylase UbiE